jgi:membrane protein YqaA with SNARE-associated domain
MNTKDSQQKNGWFARFFAHWAGHPYAPALLVLISFIEASVFPIPPYALLVPMCVAKPQRANWFALLGTVSSVLGGLLGYAIGYFAADWAKGLVAMWGYADVFTHAEAFFTQWGALSIVVSAVSPLPYKIMTIASGLFGMNLVVFVLSSLVARGLRFYVAAFSTAKVTEFVQKNKT